MLQEYLVLGRYPQLTTARHPETGAASLRAEFLLHGQSWEAALERSFVALRDKKHWSCVIQTEEQSNFIFRTFVRFEAAVHDLLKMRFTTYPLRLLELLLDPRSLEPTPAAQEAALQLLTSKACMLDSYSLHVRDSFASVEALLGADCQAMLRVVLQTLVGTTFRVETLHSLNLRRLRSRSMSHPIDLADVAVTHVGCTAPLIATVLQQAESEVGRLTKTHKGTQKNQGSGTKQRRGGGGAWRTFVHIEASKEPTHQPLGRNLAERYRALSIEEKKNLELIGRAAAVEHHEGRSAFPLTERAGQKQLQKQQQQQAAASSSVPADVLPALIAGAEPRHREGGWTSINALPSATRPYNYLEFNWG